MNYTQLTQEQRYQISALLKMGHNRTEIAIVIGKRKFTISRELSRNKGQRGWRIYGDSNIFFCTPVLGEAVRHR